MKGRLSSDWEVEKWCVQVTVLIRSYWGKAKSNNLKREARAHWEIEDWSMCVGLRTGEKRKQLIQQNVDKWERVESNAWVEKLTLAFVKNISFFTRSIDGEKEILKGRNVRMFSLNSFCFFCKIKCEQAGNHSTIPTGEKDSWQGRVKLGSDESISHVLNTVPNNILGAVKDVKYGWHNACPWRETHIQTSLKIRKSLQTKLLFAAKHKSNLTEELREQWRSWEKLHALCG